jgi:Cu/Ag efflux protein CusF
MNPSKNPLCPILFAIITFAAGTAFSQTNSSTEQPRIFVARTNHLQATVVGIDYKNRELALQGTNGHIAHFAVSDDIKNFPKIQQGDQVNIQYYESVAYALAKPGEPLTPTSRVNALATQAPGQKPGGVAMSVGNTTATIENIDRESREVTLKGVNGEYATVYVDPSVGNLQRVKEGDNISVTYTKALAVSVEKPGDSSSKTNSAPQ